MSQSSSRGVEPQISSRFALTLESSYNGYNFRSRLEARWAIFFDEMGIEYWYEPEGFEFPCGSRYLPDFYLPQVRMYGEVKPDTLTIDEEWKAKALCRATQRHIVLLIGPPAFKVYDALYWDCGEVTAVDVLLDIYAHGRRLYDTEHRLFTQAASEFTVPTSPEKPFSAEYRGAVCASRGARFDGSAA